MFTVLWNIDILLSQVFLEYIMQQKKEFCISPMKFQGKSNHVQLSYYN